MKNLKLLLVAFVAVMIGVVSCQEPIDPPTNDDNTETPVDSTETPDVPEIPVDSTENNPDNTVVSVTGIEIVYPAEGTISIKVGQLDSLTVAVLPENADNKKFTTVSSDSSVVWVDGKHFVGTSGGTAVITVTTEDGNFTDELTVNVIEEEKPVEDVVINYTQVVAKQDNIYLDLTFTNDDSGKAVFRIVPKAMDDIVGTYNSTDGNMRDADSYIVITTEEGTETHSFDPGYELVISKDGENYVVSGSGYISGDGFFGSDMERNVIINYTGPIELPEIEIGGEYDVDYKGESVNVIYWQSYAENWIYVDGSEDLGDWSYTFRIYQDSMVGTFELNGDNCGKYGWSQSADNGTITISQDGDNYTLEAIVTFKDGKYERISYTGPFNITIGY